MLDDKGRCCGRKPIVYKRSPTHLFCSRCDRAYDPLTKLQVENWAWYQVGSKFVHVTAGIAQQVERLPL